MTTAAPAAPAKSAPGKVRMIKLKDIKANSAQSRGMGVLGNLKILGYGIFEKLDPNDDKEPIWDMLLSKEGPKTAQAISLIETSEPELAAFAAKLRKTPQLQPIGVFPLEGGGYDVDFGMRRSLAFALNHAKYDDAPDTIEAKILDGLEDLSDMEKLFLALDENNDREDESPIDKAITFKRIVSEGKMKPTEIGKRVGLSDQSIRNYLNLLDPKLADKRDAIHQGKMTIDKAMTLLRQRKGTTTASSQASAGEGNRFRLPGAKGLKKIYDAPTKPKNMTEDEWELWIAPDVRKLLAYKLGLEFKEFDAEAAAEAEKAAAEEAERGQEAAQAEAKKGVQAARDGDGKAESNGKAAATSRKTIKIKRKRANKLLTALGKPTCVKWKDNFVREKLQSLVNIVEDGTKLEDASLDKLMHTLMEGYAEDLMVEIVEDEESVK